MLDFVVSQSRSNAVGWVDEASWVNTSSENEQNRNHNLAMAALERSSAVDLQNQASKDAMYQMIGKFGFDLLTS